MIACLEFTSSLQNKLDIFFTNTFSANGFSYDPKNTHRDLQNIQAVFINSGGNFWLVTKNNMVVGTAGLKIIAQHIGELKCMYVLPQFQQQGFGQLLLNKVISEAETKHLHSIRLDVKTNASKAIALYRKNCFTEIPRYNSNDNPVIFMERMI